VSRVLAACAAAALAVLTVSPVTAAAQESDQQNRIQIQINQVTPQPVTSGQADLLTVSGQLTNVGDRKISQPEIRLERGNKLDENGVRDALAKPSSSVQFSKFQPAAPSIAPGQSVSFTIAITLHGTGDNSLEINSPGVYPLMVNVNGTPDFGGLAKVGQAVTVLPVLSLPGGNTLPKPPTPTKVTVLWPLSDRPRLVSTAGTPVLTDDDLAGELATGGRLDGLLTAYEGAPAALNPAVCLAIDPDLIATAQAMSNGYQVQSPGGGVVAGKGQSSARAWLDRLKQDVVGRCVIALPAADADLNALARAGASMLVRYTLVNSELHQVLGVTPLNGFAWPIDGQLDPKTLAAFSDNSLDNTTLLSNNKVTTVLLSAATVPGADPKLLGTNGPRVIRTDDLVSTALGGGQGAATAALSAMELHAAAGVPIVVAPPHQWNVSSADATALLAGVRTMADQLYLAPTALASLSTGPTPTATATPGYSETGFELSPSVSEAIAKSANHAWDLYGSMEQEPTATTTPEQVMSPTFDGLLRASSGAWRGNDGGALTTLATPNAQLSTIASHVAIVQPRSPITLASQDSPLLVRVRNDLPVRVKVSVKLQSLTGVTASPTFQWIPASLSRDLQIDSTVVRSGRFTVDVSLTTTSGDTPLGATARLELASTAFGTINLVITGLAAVVLFGLSGHRIYRRITASRQRKAQQTDVPVTPEDGTEPINPLPLADKQPAGVPGDERSSES
jgi:hypothetical protein